LEQFARIVLVVDYQRAQAHKRPRAFDRNRRALGFPDRRSDGADRQRHFEGRALAFSRASGINRPAMQLDQVFDESQAEAEAAVPSSARRVGLAEAVKDVWQEIRADAFARVAHGDANVWVHALQLRFDATALRRELDRVGEQVPDDLLQPVRIAGDLTNFGGQVGLERD